MGFHAIKALQFAVEALEPRSYSLLAQALRDAKEALLAAGSRRWTATRPRLLADAARTLEHRVGVADSDARREPGSFDGGSQRAVVSGG